MSEFQPGRYRELINQLKDPDRKSPFGLELKKHIRQRLRRQTQKYKEKTQNTSTKPILKQTEIASGGSKDLTVATMMEGLSESHLQLLRKSGIDEQIIAVRGYRTVKTKAELRRLGFKDSQCRTPALLIPIFNVFGEIATYQIRPDEPRIKNGKPIKYETPSKSRMFIDVPPAARQWIRDPDRPLFITEGARKADAAVSKGLCCIALLGVWNFRGTNDYGGTTALADWESIALNGRQIYICFDSDVMTKPEVHAALARLKAFLESRKAQISVVYLPSGDGGAKVGLDDYLAAGNSKDDLLSLASSELRSPPQGDDEHERVVP